MDDHALGLWVAEQARAEGAVIHEQCGVRSVSTNGSITLEDGSVRQHDRVLNICGPWTERLLENSGIKSPYKLDLIRGSHLGIATALRSVLFA
jgi:glycine/D-amino acid oxidase-like deaminating enzyme